MRRVTTSLLASALVCIALGSAEANIITTASEPFTPSFRGAANTTYFGWENGTWDGNPPPNPGDPDPSPDTLNGTPSINAAGYTDLLVNNLSSDIVSGSDNIYPGGIDLTLTIPTDGVVGTGFTTIVIQGNGLSGAGFGVLLDTFNFGEINGVAPTYVVGGNSEFETQWWAKWELLGNEATYTVDIGETTDYAGVTSVTDMVVDTFWSPSDFAADTARVVPEPATLALAGFTCCGLMALCRGSRRRS